MATWRYRGVRANGTRSEGSIEAADRVRALSSVRGLGVTPIELVEAPDGADAKAPRISNKARSLAMNAIAELAVLLKAGLPLDRSLALVIENIEDAGVRGKYIEVLAEVREGVPLSRAMAQHDAVFSPAAVAMTEAGEANGRLSEALTRLAAMLEQANELRRLISTSMIYPIALLIIAVSVVLLMLLFVVPQFESVFATARGELPASSRMIMAASRGLRDYGLVLLAGVIAFALFVRYLAGRPTIRRRMDRFMLGVPQLGTIVRYIETARFSRTLGVLVDGEVALPTALMLARRTIGNHAIGDAVQQVAQGVKEGGGLTAPLAAANVLPRIAIGFFRTGEESSQLGPMLERLADVLDRDVKLRLQRLIGILTPTITVVLGGAVAAIIASIMSAILGFNDLAIAQ